MIARGTWLAALCLGAAACASPGVPFDCECDQLTDFDDTWKQKVGVCAADEREAPAVAKGCAQLAAPAPVKACTCARAAPAPSPCRMGCRE